jgi:hypothetical protein
MVKGIAIALTVVGVLLLIGAVLYMTMKASSLPSFMPGHLDFRVTKRGRVLGTHTYTKRAFALILAAAAVFGVSWWLAFRYEPAD